MVSNRTAAKKTPNQQAAYDKTCLRLAPPSQSSDREPDDEPEGSDEPNRLEQAPSGAQRNGLVPRALQG